MSTPLLSDALWNVIQPLLPSLPHRPKGGRPRLPDRACLRGILFVLRSGIPWEMLRTFAWLNQLRRLRVRYEKRVDIHEAFLALACALLCWRSLQRSGPGAIG
jgi:transposase